MMSEEDKRRFKELLHDISKQSGVDYEEVIELLLIAIYDEEVQDKIVDMYLVMRGYDPGRIKEDGMKFIQAKIIELKESEQP